MAEPRSEEGVVRYFCTAGNGMEPFLMEEVKKKLAAGDVCQLPGKVLFSSSAGIDKIRNLKAAERLFLLLKQDSPLRIPAHTSPAKAASVLQSRLLGDKNQWAGAVMTWSRLQGELAGSRTSIRTPNAAPGVTMKIGEEEEEEGNCPVESRKSPEEQREEENGNERLRDGEQNGTKKRKRNHEEEEEAERKKGKSAERERRREEEAEMDVEFNSYHGTGLENNVENSSRTMDFAAERVQNVNISGERHETSLKVSRDQPELPSSIPGSFRICCKCTGSVSRCFSAQEVSSMMGAGLSRLLGWKVDLKNPQLEINVYLSDDLCLLGIPLTRLPLAKRNYLKTTGLRSTTAWAMSSLVPIQPGFRVIDPMCGVGTILIEAAQEHEAACFLGLDIDDGQLQRANENTAFAELGNRIELLRASSLALPLPDAAADAVICDLPFGRKFGSRASVEAELPLILAEMERVLCVGGSLVLLLSPQLSCLLKKLLTSASPQQEANPASGTENISSPVCPTKQQIEPSPGLSSLRHEATFRVSLGAIDGLIQKYVKTGC